MALARTTSRYDDVYLRARAPSLSRSPGVNSMTYGLDLGVIPLLLERNLPHMPSEGRVMIHGQVGSLLEVGTGFHAELTGRDNIYLKGAILGMERSYVERRFTEIVEFSGVERFIDTPVKRYSSGMQVRLASAVAAHLQPAILIVEEVLSVGDAEFQKKCLGKMESVARGSRTVLFVSHNLHAPWLPLLSLPLDRRRGVRADADPAAAIHQYLSVFGHMESTGQIDLSTWPDRDGDGQVRIVAARILDKTGRSTARIERGRPVIPSPKRSGGSESGPANGGCTHGDVPATRDQRADATYSSPYHPTIASTVTRSSKDCRTPDPRCFSCAGELTRLPVDFSIHLAPFFLNTEPV